MNRSRLEAVSIRRATWRDSEALDRVVADALAGTGIISPVARDWRALSESRRHFIYLAEDRQPFGFVAAGEPLDAGVPLPGQGEILGIYLAPGYQGCGMGRKLLVRGLSVLKRRGFGAAFIWLPEGADRLGVVAASLGFEADGTTRMNNLAAGTSLETGWQMPLDRWF